MDIKLEYLLIKFNKRIQKQTKLVSKIFILNTYC